MTAPTPPPLVDPRWTPGPWRWTSFCESPQLEGSNEHAEMNPILVARGCSNKSPTAQGVTGCMPAIGGDDLRACPLHPTAADRALIAASPALYSALEDIVSHSDRFGTDAVTTITRDLVAQARAALQLAQPAGRKP